MAFKLADISTGASTKQQVTPKMVVIAAVIYWVMVKSFPAPGIDRLTSPAVPSAPQQTTAKVSHSLEPSFPAVSHTIRPSDLDDRVNKARDLIAERRKTLAQNESSLDASRPSFESATPSAPSVSEPAVKPSEYKPRTKKSSGWTLFFLQYGIAALFIWWRLRHTLPDLGPPLKKLWDQLKKQAASTPPERKTAASMPKSRPSTVSRGNFWSSRPASQRGGVVSRR